MSDLRACQACWIEPEPPAKLHDSEHGALCGDCLHEVTRLRCPKCSGTALTWCQLVWDYREITEALPDRPHESKWAGPLAERFLIGGWSSEDVSSRESARATESHLSDVEASKGEYVHCDSCQHMAPLVRWGIRPEDREFT